MGVEADPDGGVWAARFGLSTHDTAPGLSSLLANFRSFGDDPDAALAHTQSLWDSTVRVACAPSAPSRAARVVRVLAEVWDDVAALLPPTTDVVVDCGRWRAGGTASVLMRGCDAALVVVRPVVEHLEQLAGDAAEILAGGPVGVIVRGDGPHSRDEITRYVLAAGRAVGREGDLAVVGFVPDDPRAVKAMTLGGSTGRGSTRSLQRSALVRAMIPIANGIAAERRLTRPLTVPDVIGSDDATGSLDGRAE